MLAPPRPLRRERLAGVAVRVREPKWVYSHEYRGARDAYAADHLCGRVVFLDDGEWRPPAPEQEDA